MSEFLEFAKDTLDKYLVNDNEKILEAFYPLMFYSMSQYIDDIKVFFTEVCILVDSLGYKKFRFKDNCIRCLSYKSADYSIESDIYSCFNRSTDFLSPYIDLPRFKVVHIMFYSNMCQKISRLENLLVNNKDPENESVEDSIRDLINYRLLFEGYKIGLK